MQFCPDVISAHVDGFMRAQAHVYGQSDEAVTTVSVSMLTQRMMDEAHRLNMDSFSQGKEFTIDYMDTTMVLKTQSALELARHHCSMCEDDCCSCRCIATVEDGG